MANLVRVQNIWDAVIQDYFDLCRPTEEELEQRRFAAQSFQARFERLVYDPYNLNYDVVARLLNFSLPAERIAEAFGEHAIVSQRETRYAPELIENTLFPNLPPLAYLFDSYNEGAVHSVLEGYGLTTSKFLLGLRIHTARLTASPQVRQAVNDMYRYQIPFANSPEMSSDTLMGPLHNARQVALLPLIYGALAVAGHIEAGEYVLAMKASAASGGADFAFAAPVEIHGLITNALTKRREGEQGTDEQQEPSPTEE